MGLYCWLDAAGHVLARFDTMLHISKAVITAAGKTQRALPLQTLVDRDGEPKSALRIILDEVLDAGARDIALVIAPGDQKAYEEAAGDAAGRLTFIEQKTPLGYGHALLAARAFIESQPFLHLVSDHLYVSAIEAGCARQLVEVAKTHECAVSAVQATRENSIGLYGTIGGRPVTGSTSVYEVECVLEKPTPTLAEQRLAVPGMRAGHYLCFFGMHVLTPSVIDLLAQEAERSNASVPLQLSPSLSRLAEREKYVACTLQGNRYNIGQRYGLFMAQLALALHGADREWVLANLVELLATRPH